MELLNYLFCDMFRGILECYELTHVLPLTKPHQRQSCMSGQALLHHWLCNQKHPWGICSCSPIVNFLKVTFYHGMVTLVIFLIKQGKSEGFDSCDRPSNLTQKSDLNHRFFSPCDLEIWWMTKKNNRAPLLCYFKLFASFHSHWWIQTGVTVRKPLIWVNIDAFFSLVTLKFDGWPSKTIGHLFYATSSFMYNFVAIGEFKLELESGNAQSGSNSTLFRAVWPWNLTDDLQKQ